MKNGYDRISIQIKKPVLLLAGILMSVHLADSTSLLQEDNIITQEKQKEVIEAVCEKLEKFYAFHEVGLKTSQSISKNFKEGKYFDYKIRNEFVRQLNKDLKKISNDSHLEISYNPEMVARMREQEATGGKKRFAALWADVYRWQNFGFKECKILDGNIGYTDLRVFVPAKYAGTTAVAVMNFFSNCNALIIDLRKNGGGWDTMVSFLASYFFDTDDPVLFSVSTSTLDDSYYSSMTSTYVPGKILSDIPLYILTSGWTSSAAEAFANIMKHLSDKTTIVGENTSGAEHPSDSVVICDEFILKIPCFQRIYSATNSSWEGVGIKPDIEASADTALYAAHLDALNKLMNKETDENRRTKYRWAIDGVTAMKEPASVAKTILQSYAGKYGKKTIYYEKGELFYEFKDVLSKRRMVPISNNYFLIENNDEFRVRFIKEKDTVWGFEEIFDDGYIIKSEKELRLSSKI